MKNKYISLLLLPLLYHSCATRSLNVDFDLPGGNHMISPETSGERGNFEINGRSHIAHDVELGGSSQSESLFSSDPGAIVINQSSELKGGIAFGLNGGVGVHRRVDIIAGVSTQGVFEGGAKICVWGDPDAKKKGHKVSLYGMIGYSDEDEASNDNFFGVDDDDKKYDNVSANLVLKSQTVGVVFGHRVNEKNLYYSNFGYSSYKMESVINVNNSSSYDLGSRLEMMNILAGYRRSIKDSLGSRPSNRNFQIEVGYGRMKLWEITKTKNKRDGLIGAIGLGFSFY